MESDFWLERWTLGQTAFDQQVPHRWLEAHWPALGVRPDATVFVPLCGKAVDMLWLAQRGHRVRGAELSSIAVEGFFEMVGLSASIRREPHHDVYEAGPYELWCGDMFELPAAVFTDVEAVYDRASLVALPPEMRVGYSEFMARVLPSPVAWYLVAFSYDQAEMSGPPFSVPLDEIDALFGERFTIETLLDESVIERAAAMRERGLTAMRESLSVLRAK